MCGIRNDDGVCFSETLKPACEVRRLTSDGGFLRGALAEKVSYDYRTGRNSNTDRETDFLVTELADRREAAYAEVE